MFVNGFADFLSEYYFENCNVDLLTNLAKFRLEKVREILSK